MAPECLSLDASGREPVADSLPGEYRLYIWRGRYRAENVVAGVVSLRALEGSAYNPVYGRAQLDVSRLQVALTLEHDPAVPGLLTVLGWDDRLQGGLSLNIGGGLGTDGGMELKLRAASPAGFAGTWGVWAQPELKGAFCAVRGAADPTAQEGDR